MLLLALEVLRLVVSAETEQDPLREQYAYRELQENGSRTKAFDVILLEGRPYRKLVERNGKPLTEKERREVEADMLKTSRERRKAGLFTRTYTMRIGRLADLEKTHEITLEGNQLTAKPKADSPMLHRIQFDPQTHVMLRHEVEVVGPGSEMKPGTILIREFSRQGDGPYLVRKMIIDFKVRFAKGYQVHTFSNYRKFDAASTITFGDPK